MRRLVSTLIIMTMICNFTVYAVEFSTDSTAKSLLLMEASTGKILYEKNAHISLPPASVTKIMTMLLICEAIQRGELDLDTKITASERAKNMGGSTIFLDTNEVMTLNDLIKGIAVASANDACVAVAEHMCGSVETFVQSMNKRADELGMKNTNFVNCNGLDADNHHSSAYDIALMSRELLKHEMIFKYTTIWMDSLRGGEFQLSNTNKLIRFYNGANGLKTGSTGKAGCCISATACRDNMQLIAVVLGANTSKDRFKDASELLNYGFNNYTVLNSSKKNSEICEIPIKNSNENKIIALAKNDSCVVIEKKEKSNLKNHININKQIKPPIKKGEIIGNMITTLNGETVSKMHLVSDRNADKKRASDYFLELLRGLF